MPPMIHLLCLLVAVISRVFPCWVTLPFPADASVSLTFQFLSSFLLPSNHRWSLTPLSQPQMVFAPLLLSGIHQFLDFIRVHKPSPPLTLAQPPRLYPPILDSPVCPPLNVSFSLCLPAEPLNPLHLVTLLSPYPNLMTTYGLRETVKLSANLTTFLLSKHSCSPRKLFYATFSLPRPSPCPPHAYSQVVK